MIEKSCLYEICLEDLRKYGWNRIITPKEVKNANKVGELFKRYELPRVRVVDVGLERKLILGENEYYALILRSHLSYFLGGVVKIKPEKFKEEVDVTDSLKRDGIENAVLVGGCTSQCILDSAEHLSNYFNVIVIEDAMWDLKEDHKRAIEKLRKLSAEILKTEDLEKRLKES